ncbi:radical SAM protein [uncultured Clostridium sp.]|uniref:radical SAM protein n=1 Tax=uncultured Clostridium sp. TaxID=59620 RepID=UPI002621BB47|nr:radical SAM protein [uncultured Clostridium sp.]
MRFEKITIGVDMVGCPNRCKHCWIGHFKNGKLTEEDLKDIAKSFRKYTDFLDVYSWFRELDYSENYKSLWMLDKELSKNSIPERFELLSFWRINRDEEYVKWAYEIGVRRCQLTFFGLEEKTDYYIGRKGAFKELINATEILLENKIAPRWQMFVNKNNIHEVQKLIELSENLNLKKRCRAIGEEFELFVHQGSCDGENEKLLNIRVTEEDLCYIPKEYGDRFGKPEKILYRELIKDDSVLNLATKTPVFYITSEFDVYPNYTGIEEAWRLGNLKEDGLEKILNNYINNKSVAQHCRAIIPFNEMVKEYGNSEGNKLFDKDDYVMYILNNYCRKLV